MRQEFYGLLLAHYALRGIMHEAALRADLDPDELSFVHAVRVVKRKIITAGSFPPQESPLFHELLLEEILEVRCKSSRGRRNPRAVKRKMSNYPDQSASASLEAVAWPRQ